VGVRGSCGRLTVGLGVESWVLMMMRYEVAAYGVG